jgi:hypothetical protein
MVTVLKAYSTVVSGCPNWLVVPVLPGCSTLRRGNTLGERSRWPTSCPAYRYAEPYFYPKELDNLCLKKNDLFA